MRYDVITKSYLRKGEHSYAEIVGRAFRYSKEPGLWNTFATDVLIEYLKDNPQKRVRLRRTNA